MDKTYSPKDIEQRWYQQWEAKGYFEPSGEGESYCIMIPPPNVTGTLHMGHAFQDTVMDALIRYHRMKGSNTLWQPGTDHAGIATQMLVERKLNAEGQTRHDLGREKFIERVCEWKEESGGTITKQLRRLGASPDWSKERFTMDEGLSEAVGDVFERLYDEGLIYRGKRLVNWDTVLHTALSDIEVLNEEENGHMWHFKYPLADADGNATDEHLIVATTRPETMLGDSAVAVHPEDPRYQHLIGKFVKLPLVGRLIPIVGDEYADPEKGTGCVKITPAHDFNDYEVGKRHDLEVLNIFDDSAAINSNAPEKYLGLDRFVARKQIVSDMDELGLLDEIKACEAIEIDTSTNVAEVVSSIDNFDDVPGITSYITDNSGSNFYRIDSALTIPKISPDDWSLKITGMVDNPIEFTLADLQSLEQVDKTVTISCVSNPIGEDLVGNAVWTGIPLTRLLEIAQVQEGATQLVGKSADGWTAGFPPSVLDDGRSALLAIGMNGIPLPARHGFPARLVIAGLYGYVSATKWITEINMTTWEDFDGYWIPRGWSKEGPIKTTSRIDVPSHASQLPQGNQVIAGVAWAPTRGVSKVEVRIDEGDWVEAELGEAVSNETWVQWKLDWPAPVGDHVIRVRAFDGNGDIQPEGPKRVDPDGAEGWHAVVVRIA